jgi:hypothetical protein
MSAVETVTLNNLRINHESSNPIDNFRIMRRRGLKWCGQSLSFNNVVSQPVFTY